MSQDCLHLITILPWSARSPDLSPIKHFWDLLGGQIGQHTSFVELEVRLQQMWNEVFQDIMRNLLEQEDYSILKRLIPADEAWLYHYDPTIKQQSSDWKHQTSPTPKKAKTVKSTDLNFFWIMKELCINTLPNMVLPLTARSYYANVLRTMVQHVKRKRPLLGNGFLLHHDNARQHIARCVLAVSQQNNIDILPQPPYSPDLTPCDFWLFPLLKKPLRGKRFASNKACVEAEEVVFEIALTKRNFTCF
ncbi:histone-lysine N-methyltransferase SETMAR [Trichonephila clavipes]|nr:histone-lysine N-methyltransferase SETMAR [Trichonephila clavipes]